MADLADRAVTATHEETAVLLNELFLSTGRPYDSDFDYYVAKNTPESLLAAAMMLKGDDWLIINLSELGGAGGCSATIGNPGTGVTITADDGERTLALALIAAVAQAEEL